MAERTGRVTRGYLFTTIPEWVLWHPGLSPLAVRVYGTLDRRGQTPDKCWPSHAWIAEKVGISVRSVSRVLAELDEVGAVRAMHRGSQSGGRTSDAYWLAGDGPLPALTALLCLETDGVTGQDEQGFMPSASPSNRTQMAEEREPSYPEPVKENSLALVPAFEAACDFDAFWTVYPRKVAKGAAKKAWDGAVKKAQPHQIVVGANDYAEWARAEDPKFVAHPATWLNGERWLDEPPAPKVDQTMQMLAAFGNGAR